MGSEPALTVLTTHQNDVGDWWELDAEYQNWSFIHSMGVITKYPSNNGYMLLEAIGHVFFLT